MPAAVYLRKPVATGLRYAVRTVGLKGRRFGEWHLHRATEHCCACRLEIPDIALTARQTDCFEQVQRTESVREQGVLGLLETVGVASVRAEVVDLVRRYLADDAQETGEVVEVASMQCNARVKYGRFGAVPGLSTVRSAPDDAVYLVTLGQQLLGKVMPILSGNAEDKRPPSGMGVVILHPLPLDLRIPCCASFRAGALFFGIDYFNLRMRACRIMNAAAPALPQ